jgi:Flp pilus assembly protein TadB
MAFILVMASMTILLMVLAFLTLTREDREIVQEQLTLDAERKPALAAVTVSRRTGSFQTSLND